MGPRPSNSAVLARRVAGHPPPPPRYPVAASHLCPSATHPVALRLLAAQMQHQGANKAATCCAAFHVEGSRGSGPDASACPLWATVGGCVIRVNLLCRMARRKSMHVGNQYNHKIFSFEMTLCSLSMLAGDGQKAAKLMCCHQAPAPATCRRPAHQGHMARPCRIGGPLPSRMPASSIGFRPPTAISCRATHQTALPLSPAACLRSGCRPTQDGPVGPCPALGCAALPHLPDRPPLRAPPRVGWP